MLVAIVVLACSTDAITLWRRIGRFDVAAPGSPPGGRTYLLIGSDSRAFVDSERERERYGSTAAVRGARADIVLLVRIGDHGTRVLELPRDLRVFSPQAGIVELASTFEAGPQGTVDSLCRTLGIGIDHVAVLEFDGLESVVDVVGGVEIRSDAPTRDRVTGLHIAHAGATRLDGEQALAYIRARHVEIETTRGWEPVPSQPIDRARRAQIVLDEVGARLDTSFMHPFATHRRLWALTGALRVDRSMGVGDMRALQHALARLTSAPRYTLPSRPAAGASTLGLLSPDGVETLETFEGASGTSSGRCAMPGTPPSS